MVITHPLTDTCDQLQKAFIAVENFRMPDGPTRAEVREFPEAPVWFPAIRILETQNSYIFRINTPGVDPKDVFVSADNGVLTLGIHNQDRFTRRDLVRKIQRNFPPEDDRQLVGFSRSLALPANVAPDRANLKTEDGLLQLILAKLPTAGFHLRADKGAGRR